MQIFHLHLYYLLLTWFNSRNERLNLHHQGLCKSHIDKSVFTLWCQIYFIVKFGQSSMTMISLFFHTLSKWVNNHQSKVQINSHSHPYHLLLISNSRSERLNFHHQNLYNSHVDKEVLTLRCQTYFFFSFREFYMIMISLSLSSLSSKTTLDKPQE